MEKKFAFVFFVSLLISVFETSFSTSYTWCLPCICDDAVLFCGHQKLSEINIVKQMPSVHKVSFEGNEISAVRGTDFLNVYNLNELDLSFNEIRTIESSAFKPLTIAKKIDISYNRIENIKPDTFDFENQVESLLMEENLISNIDFISNIRSCLLVDLNLSFNSLVRITGNAFSNCRKIENLQLNNNDIDELDPQAFDGLYQLRVLNLANNYIKTLSFTLCTQQLLLEKLDISKNAITVLPSKAFTKCSNLRTLLLRGNDIHKIHDDAFIEFSEKNWTDNYDPYTHECLKGLQSDSDSYLTYVDLSHNTLRESTFSGMFQHLKHLSHLDLSHNFLKDFSPSLLCLMAISQVTIKLEENYFYCDCGIIYEAFQVNKVNDIELLNFTCVSSYGNYMDWHTMNCDDQQTRIRYVAIFSLVGLVSILAVVMIFARLYYMKIKATREINPDL